MTSAASSLQQQSLASSPSRFLTVLDVYDLAESINRDFEDMAEHYGKESIEGIVRKVICALETLEALAKNNDTENSEIVDLQREIQHLEQDKQQRIHDKDVLEKDILELEENYKKEIDELCRVVKSLQSENKSIKRRLEAFDNGDETNTTGNQSSEPGSIVFVNEEEFQMMIDLRSTSKKQREQIKELQHDVDNYVFEVDNLQNNIEKLIRQNKELLRKNASLQKQGRLLVQERADLQRRWQRAEETNLHLRRMLTEASRACADLEAEKHYEQENESSQRFTLEELHEILQEKTLLKARVIELEEQLDLYRGQSTSSVSLAFALDQELDNLSTEEYVVYGPINREPDEKINPLKYERRNSGVRKLFRFFKELNSSSGSWSPRRPSSNLSSSSLLASSNLKEDPSLTLYSS